VAHLFQKQRFMPKFINIVCTRAKQGDHANLHRWYNDHVHILMGFAALEKATLYRRVEGAENAAQSSAPDYLCIYEFANQADFMAFETSAARARARQILEGGWGLNGIEITGRTQYQRLGARQNGGANSMPSSAPTSSPTQHHFQSVNVAGFQDDSALARWLSDRSFCAVAADAFSRAHWYSAAALKHADGDSNSDANNSAVREALLHFELDSARPAPLAWTADSSASDFGISPVETTPRWQGIYSILSQWSR
jgi:hypothetical protein